MGGRALAKAKLSSFETGEESIHMRAATHAAGRNMAILPPAVVDTT